MLTFIIIGLGTGALYVLVTQGLVLIYKGSGILNFAQGSQLMAGAYSYYELRVGAGLPGVVAIIGAVLIGALIGIGIQTLILKPMRASAPVLRVIATLGVLVVLQSIAVLKYGTENLAAPGVLPSGTVDIAGAHPTISQLIILGLGIVVTAGLWAVFRYSRFGRVTRAVAENPLVASSLGHSPERAAMWNWAVGSGLAALAGALYAPITFIEPTELEIFLIPALAAGLVASFSSFPGALGAGLGIGVIEALVTRYVSTPGWSDAVPFIVIILLLVVRGRGLPLRGTVVDRLPVVGSGRVRLLPTVVVLVAGVVVANFVLPEVWQSAFTITMSLALICLSVVVVTGYAGQLSLAQYVLAGVAALIAAALATSWGIPFVFSALIAVVATVVVGVVVGLPALRSRGINLAIVSLGVAVVIFDLVLSNTSLANVDGIFVPPPTLFGWSINPALYPGRYAAFTFVVFVVLGVMVCNVRRGESGRRMLAIRSNERAAASLGVNVPAVKLYAFSMAAGIAGVGGILYAFLQASVLPSQFDFLSSINFVTVTVVGGVGSVGGAVFGATMLSSGVFSQLLQDIHGLATWLPLIGGISLLLIVRSDPDGLMAINRRNAEWVVRRLSKYWHPAVGGRTWAPGLGRRTWVPGRGRPAEPGPPGGQAIRVVARGLRVEGLSVRFGGNVALSSVGLEVVPGEVHGLIGPNGAGKTTMIDAITGFVSGTSGRVYLGGRDITTDSVRRRARGGIGRSFQSLELFDDMSVIENLAVACDGGGWTRYLSDLVRPRRVRLSNIGLAAVEAFALAGDEERKPAALPYGKRRLVAIARAVALEPSVLLLDEPAAGLDRNESEELGLLVRKLARDWGIGILLVEHNVDMVLSTCDRVTVLVQGEVLMTGTVDEVQSHPGVLAAYLGQEGESRAADAAGQAADGGRPDPDLTPR